MLVFLYAVHCWCGCFLLTVSGRSSAIGDVTVDSTATGAHSDVGSIGGGVTGHGETSVGGPVTLDSDSLEADYDFNRHVHGLRLRILDRLIYYLPELRDVGGVRAIPFLQVCYFIPFHYSLLFITLLYHLFKIYLFTTDSYLPDCLHVLENFISISHFY